MKSIIKNSGLAVLVALFVFSFSATAMANDGSKPSAELKFIGNVESRPVYQLSLQNSEADEYYITISDLSGNVLYSDRVKGTNVTRKFALNTDEIGDNVLKLEIKTRSNNKKESFTISRTQKYVTESIVSRIN